MQDLETLLSGPAGFDPMTAQSSIRIAGSDFFAEILMPKLAALIGRRAPGMQVQMVNLVPESYAAVLERAEVDMALIPQGDFPEWIATQALFRSDFVMIARSGHPRLAGLAPGGWCRWTCFAIWATWCSRPRASCRPWAMRHWHAPGASGGW